MNLKCLVHRELGEGMTEKELASAVGVSARAIADILANNLPQDPAIWETFSVFSHSSLSPQGRAAGLYCLERETASG